MALDVETCLQAVVQVLRDNTSTIAGSLSMAEIRTIREGDPRSAPVAVDEYPAILVRLATEDESFAQLGQRNNLHKLEFLIFPMIHNSAGDIESDKDARTMAKNVKSVLKSNIRLSNTALSSLPKRVDYFGADLDGIYLSSSQITFEAEYLST